MSLILRLSIFLVFLAAIDVYAYQAFRTAFREAALARYLYWAVSGGMLLFMVYLMLTFDRSAGPHNQSFKYFMGSFVLFFVPKLIIIFFLVGEDLTRFLVGIAGKFAGSTSTNFMPDRRRFVSLLALGAAAIPFAGILHGIFKGRYNYRVIKKTVTFNDLPAAFDGLTVTQISDVHSGSFDNAKKIDYAIDLINSQKSDLILFTGDLVNNEAREMEPWVETFSRLKAPMGKFSILGNHDYGDYVEWPSAKAKEENMQTLYGIHEKIGFRLMRNESIALQKEGQKINLLGVENWGSGGFVKYGDLEKASANVDENDFNILMSHDPSHFEEIVKKFTKKMHLTLSGHTHGMQFGIEIPGFIKWSPVQYRYKKWAGLYQELGRYLYINRGFGFLAFPGRVGIWPEITVLTLKRG
jgi:predicted MPP superfamily phosphohydrolase